MLARLGAITALGGAVACGGGASYPVVRVANGGVAVARGSCTEPALSADLEIVPASSPGCESSPGFLVPEHAAVAFWQVATPTWAGPTLAPPASVEVSVPKPLVAGESDKGLTSGSRDTALRAGSSDVALRSGSSDVALRSGSGEVALRSGSSEVALRSGSSEVALRSGSADKPVVVATADKSLVTGSSDKPLFSGSSDKPLETGSADKPAPSVKPVESASAAVDPLSLSKQGSGRATRKEPATFTLIVTNLSDVELRRVAVVDRVDHSLRVEADGARTAVLPDGSTLVIYRPNGPLGAHEKRSFSFDVYAR